MRRRQEMPSLHSTLHSDHLVTWLLHMSATEPPQLCAVWYEYECPELAIAHRPESGSEPALAPQPRAGHRSRATAATVKVEIFSAAARWVLR